MPRREARVLMGHVLGVAASAMLDQDPAMTVEHARHFGELLARRLAREPMALIIGSTGFWTLDLEVSADTLIPRADSEALIEAAMTALPDPAAVRRILDLGTGTGCLLLAALSMFPKAFGVGVDVNPAAAALARRNAKRNALAHRAAFIAADWSSALAQAQADGFDLVLCNPPYIESAAIPALMPEVARYEPVRALDGGHDGYTAYAGLMPDLARLLAPGGVAILEAGAGQAPEIARMAATSELRHIASHHDLGGIERAVVLKRR